jgi:hypothetical protein
MVYDTQSYWVFGLSTSSDIHLSMCVLSVYTPVLTHTEKLFMNFKNSLIYMCSPVKVNGCSQEHIPSSLHDQNRRIIPTRNQYEALTNGAD